MTRSAKSRRRAPTSKRAFRVVFGVGTAGAKYQVIERSADYIAVLLLGLEWPN
jgi:hypothetical protein